MDVGEIIAEVETDKATISIECYDDGYLIEQCAQEGEKIPVGEVIAKLDSSMPGERKQDSAPPSASPTDLPRRAVSPLARRLSIRLGVDLSLLAGKGTGPKGRIMAQDVRDAKSSPAPVVVKKEDPLPFPVKKTEEPAKPAAEPAEDKVIPLSQRQKFVAEVTSSAKSNTPHFYVTVEADVTQLEQLRNQVNIQAQKTHGNHFTFNDFIIRALVNACRAVPSVNSSFDEDKQAIVHHSHIGVNVAVDANGSVLIPVLKNAGTKSMMTMSGEIRDISERARDNRLRPSDFEGGTITLTNLGARGVEHFYAIINTPQAAIVSIGAIVEKPVVRKEAVVVGQCVSISMSCDHRVVNGLDAARFLDEMKTLLETPTLLLV